MAKFRFADLCDKPLSAADYLEVTKNFGTVFLLDIPKMGLDSKDKVRFSMFKCCVITDLALGTEVHHVHRRVLRKQGS